MPDLRFKLFFYSLFYSQMAKKSTLEIQIKEKLAQDEEYHSICEIAEKCTKTCQAAIDISLSMRREIEEFSNMESQKITDILEFGTFYRDIANIVESESRVLRRISQLQIVSQNFDMRCEKKLQSSLSEQIKAIEAELQKQKQFNALHASQLSHIEAALDNQAQSFESEFEASNIQIKQLQEEKNSLVGKEMTLRKNIQRMSATINARSKRAMAKGSA
jgi:hypothetical protein